MRFLVMCKHKEKPSLGRVIELGEASCLVELLHPQSAKGRTMRIVIKEVDVVKNNETQKIIESLLREIVSQEKQINFLKRANVAL